MDLNPSQSPVISADFVDHFAKTTWTVSRGLRPARSPARQLKSRGFNEAPVDGRGRRVADTALLEKRCKSCLLSGDYQGLLQTAKQILDINSHSATAWLHVAVALLGLEGVCAQKPFVSSDVLSSEKRLQINVALRALHTASICKASTETLAEICVMKALARFSLGQMQGAYLELQFALRYLPDFAVARDLMQNPAMETLHPKHTTAFGRG